VNTVPQDTEQQAATREGSLQAPHAAYDPQAVQVEKSGISAADSVRHKRSRNIAIALALGAFVILIFVITIVKLSANALNQPM